jgi:hypothetical protein
MKKFLFYAFIVLSIFGCGYEVYYESSSSSSWQSSSSVVASSDFCDIKDYKTVNIGNQIWMAENLNCKVSGSRCYKNNGDNCNIYGRLYNWATAMKLPSKCNDIISSSDTDCTIKMPHRGICPPSWHIPSNEEWDELISTVGNHLKAENGFSALLGGQGDSGKFSRADSVGYWWSANEYRYPTGEYSSVNAYYRYIVYNNDGIYWNGAGKSYLFSVRCLQD